MPSTEMRAALAAALDESEETVDETEVTDTTAPPETNDEATVLEDATPAEPVEAADDAPDEYYGVSLEGLSAEQRAAIVSKFSEQDKFIQQLLRNQAESAEAETEQEAPAVEEEGMSDKDILEALGLNDPDDVFAEHTAKVALPLAKLVLDLNQKVEGLSTRSELDMTERYWESSLTALEAQFGKLPISHDEVLAQAAKAKVAEPVDAYWRIMGPARQQVMTEVQRRREELTGTLKKGVGGSRRPTADAETSEKPIEADNVKDAMKSALAALAKERGITFME